MSGVLVHEWIAQSGGSENVLQAMSEVFPEAPVVCLWNDSHGRFDPERVQETWLARTPLRRSKAAALPLMPLVWRGLQDHGYDWAMISSHAFAHHARFRGAGPDFRRLVYVHTPARYVWTPELDARGTGAVARLVSRGLQPIDRRRAREGAEFAANSEYVAERIRRVWDVEPIVIHPPVDVERIQAVRSWADELTTPERALLDELPDGFVLGASRFIPYKELERVIEVGEALGRPVVLAGSGPSRPALAARAARSTVPVSFVDGPSSSLLFALYQRTALYVFPALEDFGIMPVEAMAAGAPVLARATGGAAESTVHARTGALVHFEDRDEIREGARTAMSTDPDERRRRATMFGRTRFAAELRTWVEAS